MSSVEFEPPKYARVVLEVRRRIEEGEYPAGSLLPSESQLVREFAVGRTTVVRALQILQQEGWISREHGRGSFVRGRPDPAARTGRPGLAVLDRPETLGAVQLVKVGRRAAPAAVARVLEVDQGARLAMRQWVRLRDGIPSELVTCWFPQELAYGTDLEREQPLPVGIRAHLRAVKDLRIDHIAERLTARRASREEAETLRVKADQPVLVILATMYDAANPRFTAQVVMPGSMHELEDVYSVPD